MRHFIGLHLNIAAAWSETVPLLSGTVPCEALSRPPTSSSARNVGPVYGIPAWLTVHGLAPEAGNHFVENNGKCYYMVVLHVSRSNIYIRVYLGTGFLDSIHFR